MKRMLDLPSARKRLQMKIWGFVFTFAFVMERQINSPGFSFAFAFAMIMLGTDKPQQQALLTKYIKIPEIFFCFRFRNAIERKSQILGFLFIFACNYFYEDGSRYALVCAVTVIAVSGVAFQALPMGLACTLGHTFAHWSWRTSVVTLIAWYDPRIPRLPLNR